MSSLYWLLGWSLLAFVAGFAVTWLATIDSKDSFVIFESDEELQQACWEGLRRGMK
jgi:hypothetical protein